jgi:uroporphyrinogen decarboxylase
MTPRERVQKTLRFETTDVVPWQVEFTREARRKMAEFCGDSGFEAKIGNHLAKLSHRNVAGGEWVQPGFLRDEWGVVWNRTEDADIGVVANRVLGSRSLEGYRFPDPNPARLREHYARFVEENRPRFRMASMAFTLFERAWSLRGMDELMVDMLEAPGFVHELLDRILEFNMAQIEVALAQDVDCVFFGDDWAGQHGLLMGPRPWREFIQPRAAAMYARTRRGGKRVMIHSCGDVRSLLPELVEMGVEVFNPFQPEVMDVVATKRRFQGKLAFYGGISVQRLLPRGTPDEVREETRRLLAELGPGGGYLAAPSHSVSADVPPGNVAALLEVLQGQSPGAACIASGAPPHSSMVP